MFKLIWSKSTEKFCFCFICSDLELQYFISYVQLHIIHNYMVVYIKLLMPSFLNENVTVKKFWILFEENMVAIFYVKLLLYNLFTLKALHWNALDWVHNFFANNNHFNLRDRTGKYVPIRATVVPIS